MSEVEEKNVQPMRLNEEKEPYGIFLLNEPSYAYRGGLVYGEYRLLTAHFGADQVAIFEAMSGTERYPPGRNMHVELSFEEIEKLWIEYSKIKVQREKDKAEQATRQQSDDDFDPFLDSDELP